MIYFVVQASHGLSDVAPRRTGGDPGPRFDQRGPGFQAVRGRMFQGAICLPCPAGLHEECFHPSPIDGDDGYMRCCCYSEPEPVHVEPTKQGRRELDGTEMRDVTSTGRKRAAREFPITDGMECEWSGLKNAGGGVVPIVGCNGNKLRLVRGGYARHHGPDKSTLNNSPGNVHRICPTCHNRWHAANDKYYGKRPPSGGPFLPVGRECLPHDPQTLATPADFVRSEVEWNTASEAVREAEERVNADDGDDTGELLSGQVGEGVGDAE